MRWSVDKNWVFVYSTASDQRQGGVGILMLRQMYKCLQSVKSITNRIITATFYGNPKPTVTSIYAPTECAPPDDRNEFYNNLEDHLEQVKTQNIRLVEGDFNARVGRDSHLASYRFYDTTNNNGERLVSMCEEQKLRPAQMTFPQLKCRQWTWMRPTGSKHQLDHILINSKWSNSLWNCRAYSTVELDSDHRIVSILLLYSLRTTKGKPFCRLNFDWSKLQDAATRDQFQIELSNRFKTLQCNDTSAPITERYKEFEHAVSEVTERVVSQRGPCGLSNWVTIKTIQLKAERDEAKRRFLVSKSRQSRKRWR